MMKRTLLAGLLGGIAMFAWGSVSHMLLPISEIGIKEIPNEAAMLEAMEKNLAEPGLYLFPGMGLPPNATPEQQKAAWNKAMEKHKTGPAGVLVYRPIGGEALSPTQLLTEFASNVMIGLLAALLLLLHAVNSLPSFWHRLLYAALLGLLPGLAISVSYWNWYGFPLDYTLVTIFNECAGFIAMGAPQAWLIKPE